MTATLQSSVLEQKLFPSWQDSGTPVRPYSRCQTGYLVAGLSFSDKGQQGDLPGETSIHHTQPVLPMVSTEILNSFQTIQISIPLIGAVSENFLLGVRCMNTYNREFSMALGTPTFSSLITLIALILKRYSIPTQVLRITVLTGQQPKRQSSSKQSPCWGCNGWKHFSNLSEMLRHIENHECRSHWTIRQINALAEKCNGFSRFIIPGRQDWFRRGAPPLKPQKNDYDRYNDCYLCPNCDEIYENMSELKEHLEERECSYDYPSVLRCPSCPESGFERLSDLVQHLEQRNFQTGCAKAWMTGVFQSLKRKFEDAGAQRRTEMDQDELLVGERRPRGSRVNMRNFYDDKDWIE